ncbi:MAG: RNA polymerase sigma factor [Actinomycetota bacterium]|nr:RNA polymerase sigma factor [Actinomycetota bacterium]
MAVDIEDSLKRDLELLAKGSRSSFNGVVLASSPMVRGFVKRYFTGDTCDDVVQEVFLQVFRSSKRYDKNLSAKSWILGIAHHVIVDEIRRRSRKPVSVENDLTQIASLADDSIELEDVILRLSKDQFDVIYATKIVGLSYEETAEALSIPIGTVKSRIFAARRELSEMLYGNEPHQIIKRQNLA